MVLGKFIFLKGQDFFGSPIAAKRMMDAVRVWYRNRVKHHRWDAIRGMGRELAERSDCRRKPLL